MRLEGECSTRRTSGPHHSPLLSTLPNESRGKPVGGLTIRAAAAPAEREPGQDLGELLPDLGQLECEVALVSPGLGRVSLGQHGEHTGLPEVPQVVDVAGRPAGDVGVDVESPVQLEARLLDLGIEAGDEELNASQPGRRRGRLAKRQAAAKPTERQPRERWRCRPPAARRSP